MTDNTADIGIHSRTPFIRSTKTRQAKTSTADANAARQPHIRTATELPPSDHAETVADLNEEIQPLPLAPINWWERAGFFKGALITGALLIILLLSIETIVLIDEMFSFSGILASVLIVTLVAFISLICLALLREYQQLRALRSLANLRAQGERLLESDAYGGAADYLSEVRTLYGQREDLVEPLAEFERHQDQHLSDAEQVRRLSLLLGEPLDRQAQRLIANNVRQLAIWTALNPLALLDSLVVLWLTLKMIRGIAEIYGGRPGLIASWKLMREVALLVAAAGATDLLVDSATDTIGVGIAGMVSGKLAQGVVTGLFVAWVGVYALKICRPIPFEDDKNTLWKGLRQEVFKIFDR